MFKVTFQENQYTNFGIEFHELGFFSEDVGYTEYDIKAIKALKVGDVYTSEYEQTIERVQQ